MAFTITTASLLANDTGNGLTVISVSQPQSGRVAFDGQTITYYPPAPDQQGNYPASDSFTYMAQDRFGQTGNATVRLTLEGCPPAPPPPVTGIQAVDDAISITAVLSDTEQTYRSSLKLNPYTYMTYNLGYATGDTITICGAAITVGQYDGLDDFANKVNAALGSSGYEMYNTDDQGNRLTDFNSQDGYVVIARGDPYFSQDDVASLPAKIWGTPTQGFYDGTQRQDIVYPASVFLTNDQINSTTTITAITQPNFMKATLDVSAQTITITQPNKYGNGDGIYGNIITDHFTYTISDASGQTSTATVTINVDNGAAVSL